MGCHNTLFDMCCCHCGIWVAGCLGRQQLQQPVLPNGQSSRPLGLLQPASALCLQVGWLKATRADLVISDTVPLACAAAKLAGLPCACISNFSWGEPT